ncbi:MAG: spore germination protein, partial [Tissierellales bacterium]
YYGRWIIGTLVRFVRILSAILTAITPALYISFTAYHPGLMPTAFTMYLAASRVNVPFPAVVEAFLMETTIEILRESGTRIAGPIGTTIGIVGGIIIGQAAVEAGIVSPLKIIITALTTISFFAMPSFEFASSLRVIRFILMFLAAILGLYGVMLGVIILMVHLAKLESFTVPFSAPYSGLGLKEGDLKDTLVKVPVRHMKYRPKFTFPKDKRRMR